MSSDIAISVKNLTKTYRLFNHPGDRIKQALTFGCVKFHKEFTALKDVSFDIKKGETVGIIGRNGSGKSTLLQLICGILKPTSGSVTVNGRISALLELGSGFNPEFTGRENIYFQGAIMGFSQQEMDTRIEDIIAFADIGEFVDQPVRAYSSGMFLRMAFAVAVNVDPEILVIDEALAVGDPGFRSRCFHRIGELRNIGCTILFVSHAMEQIINLCGRVLLLEKGELRMYGEPDAVVHQFQSTLDLQFESPHGRKQLLGIRPVETNMAETEAYDPALVSKPVTYSPNGAVVTSVELLSLSGVPVNLLHAGRKYQCLFKVKFEKDATNVRFVTLIKNQMGWELGGAISAPSPEDGVSFINKDALVEVIFQFDCLLNHGLYHLSVAAFGSIGGVEYALHGITDALIFRVGVSSGHPAVGAINLNSTISVQVTAPEND